MTRNNFRDPKIWQEADGSYRCVIGACRENRLGSILLYSSADGYRWHFESILAENDGSFGRMWECPDLFELDGKAVLLVSPQDMLPKGHERSADIFPIRTTRPSTTASTSMRRRRSFCPTAGAS